jgi:predicted SnoaL-like aldol condensation-catalyzing enzyme
MAASNKEIAVAFLQMASGGDVGQAYAKYVAPDFRHHNPHFEGSARSLQRGMEESARQNPSKSLEVKRAIGEDDLVVVHSRVRQWAEDPGSAVVHIFRFENGRIAELWDVAQPVPEQSPNQFTMF